jgi:hypothetical protein
MEKHRQSNILPLFTNRNMKHRIWRFGFLAAVAILGAGATQAANLIVNPSFEANGGHAIPVGWTRFAPPTAQPFGNYWVEQGVRAHTGSLYWKQWGASYSPAPTNNVAGIYQEFNSSPGSVYQASGWFFTPGNDTFGPDCYLWTEVSFLSANSNLLALYKSANFNRDVGIDTWFQYAITNACDVSAPVSIDDPFFTTYAITGSVSQLIAPLGTAKVVYRFCYLQNDSQGGAAFFEDAVLDQISGPAPPVISNLFPLNAIFVNPADGITFNVTSPSGYTINSNAIRVEVNGTNVSGSLAITGSASSKNVAYYGLQSNSTYNVSITATDSFNFTVSANTYFETTWVGVPPIVYLWEAEDFDFTNGMYINFPELCNAPGNPNCYFGKVGVEGVDEHNINPGPNHLYRPDDPMGTGVAGDFLRKNLVAAGRLDYKIDPFQGGEWMNYTRDWSNGTYWVLGRLATGEGLSGTLTLSKVNPDTTTTDLGTFTIDSGRGWSTYDNIFLRNTNGNIANIPLNGKTTLRVTSGGNLLPNFFMLVPAIVDLPIISGMYPTGKHPFEPTNALSFTLTTEGATFPADGIKVILDGLDVSSNLVVTGSSSNKSVVYSGLLPNARHTALITVTNSLGHGIAITNRFDTFSQDNYMVEAEDFDYDGGQFVNPWFPESYSGFGATTNIDFQHSPFVGEQFTYRIDGIPEGLTTDYLKNKFIDVGARDYDLTWFGNGDWANYTRNYPAGNYYVYGRFSGLGGYSMYLDQVVSGAGTTNQVVKRLGRWGAVGKAYNSYDWVPLTDEGLAAPVLVRLNGLSTLRIATTGNSNPNYFMLVPAIGVKVSAARTGNNVAISFPTQAGVLYRVFYRDSLGAGNWNVLSTVPGDGTVKSVTDPAGAAQRFYMVTAP